MLTIESCFSSKLDTKMARSLGEIKLLRTRVGDIEDEFDHISRTSGHKYLVLPTLNMACEILGRHSIKTFFRSNHLFQFTGDSEEDYYELIVKPQKRINEKDFMNGAIGCFERQDIKREKMFFPYAGVRVDISSEGLAKLGVKRNRLLGGKYLPGFVLRTPHNDMGP